MTHEDDIPTKFEVDGEVHMTTNLGSLEPSWNGSDDASDISSE
jgi:hypothetical protein